MNTWFWEKIIINGSNLPTSREGHSFLYNSKNCSWIVFGGVGSVRSNETLSLNPVTGQWKVLNKSMPPLERAYHISWLDSKNNFLYIFGGQGSKREPIYDMHVLFLDSGKWVKLGPSERPAGRIHSAGCIKGSFLYLFGGASAPNDTLHNDLWSFPYKDINWHITEKEGHCPGWIHHNIALSPEKRKGHSMVSDNENIYIFGGTNGKDYLNDLCCISPPINNWYIPHTFGQSPSPRAYHSCTVTSSWKMIVFGGKGPLGQKTSEVLNDVYILDMKDKYWSSPFIGGFYPSNRYGAGMAWGLNINNHEQILIVGGIGNNYAGMDVFTLEEKTVEANTLWHLEDLQSGKLKHQVSAESTSLSNRKKIRDFEGQIYMIQEKNSFIEDDIFTLKGKIEIENNEKVHTEKRFKDLSKTLKTEIKNTNFSISKFKKLSRLKGKKIKNLELRVSELAVVFREIESFLIIMDNLFYDTISLNITNNAFATFGADQLEEISERKKSHEEALILLRSWYETSISSESELICQQETLLN